MPPELKIDKDFKKLTFPLEECNRRKLISSLVRNGCVDPIITWNGVIVDGHKRYEICTKNHIAFDIEPTTFDCKESAMIWICSKQLERVDIPNNMRNYLIGFYYRLVKYTTGRKNRRDPDFNYTSDGKLPASKLPRMQKTAEKVGKIFHLSAPSIRKYAAFSRDVDRIEKKVPWGANLILSGNCKISKERLSELSWGNPQSIATELQACRKKTKKKAKMKSPAMYPPQNEVKPQTIKDMPAFDPDGTFTELTLTIPYWSKSVKRTLVDTDISLVSSKAKAKLLNVLNNHQIAIQELINSIKE